MNVSAYSAYLKTPYWQELRLRILRRAGGLCEFPKCRRGAVAVHHKTYHRCPWYEREDDLIACCSAHHKAMDQIRRQEAAAQRRGRPVAADFCGMSRRLGQRQLVLTLHRQAGGRDGRSTAA